MKSNEIAFRRINGRIVPIRVKKGAPSAKASTDLKQGAALVAGGVASSLVAGEAAARLVKKSAQFRQEAKTLFSLGYRGVKGRGLHFAGSPQASFNFGVNRAKAAEQVASAVGKRVLSGGLFKLRNVALGAGALIGGSMIAAGLHRLNRQGDKKGVSLPEELATNAAGVAAAGLAAGFYYRRLGVSSLGSLVNLAYSRMKGRARMPVPVKFKWRGGHQGTLKF